MIDYERKAAEFFRDLKPADNWTEKLAELMRELAWEEVAEQAPLWNGL